MSAHETSLETCLPIQGWTVRLIRIKKKLQTTLSLVLIVRRLQPVARALWGPAVGQSPKNRILTDSLRP